MTLKTACDTRGSRPPSIKLERNSNETATVVVPWHYRPWSAFSLSAVYCVSLRPEAVPSGTSSVELDKQYWALNAYAYSIFAIRE
jgi:hypothetical protein